MKLRSDSWAGVLTEAQTEEVYALAIKSTPRHAIIPDLAARFGVQPSKTAFYNWLTAMDKDAWRRRLKNAVSVGRTMQAALPDDADALYRDSLVALGVDAAVQADPHFAIAIGKTLSAMNKDREARLKAQITELKARIEAILADTQKAAAPLDPARLAAEIDDVLGRKPAAKAA